MNMGDSVCRGKMLDRQKCRRGSDSLAYKNSTIAGYAWAARSWKRMTFFWAPCWKRRGHATLRGTEAVGREDAQPVARGRGASRSPCEIPAKKVSCEKEPEQGK